jgi:hypothetical protein
VSRWHGYTSLNLPNQALHRHTSKAKERGLQHKEFEIRQAEKKALEDEMHNYRDASEKQITELLGEYQRTKDEMGKWNHGDVNDSRLTMKLAQSTTCQRLTKSWGSA